LYIALPICSIVKLLAYSYSIIIDTTVN